MPKIGRPRGRSKASITRALNVPKELYDKCIWISDHWTRESFTETADGKVSPEYWSFSKVVSSILREYFVLLEANDPNLVSYFENCRNREEQKESYSELP
jgi:hypothetical protein